MPDKRGSQDYDDDEGGVCDTLRLQSSLDDMVSLNFWKALLAEFVGTFILVISAVGSTVQGWSGDPLDIVQISLSFGLCVATSVWIIGHVSGGHINPAVTIAMLVARRISLLRTVLYIGAQCIGSIAAAATLKSLTPEAMQGGLGCTTLNKGMTTGMGVGVELFITCFFIMTVFATCDSQRTDHGGSFPLSIGFSIAIGHLWAVEFTGASMNPARSLGPAVAMKTWEHHWVYWVGPIAGGVIAALLYDIFLSSNASFRKSIGCITSSRFDDDKYRSKKGPPPASIDDGYEIEVMNRPANTV